MKTPASKANITTTASGSITAPTTAVDTTPKLIVTPSTTIAEELQFQTPNAAAPYTGGNAKRPASLELNKGTPAKKQRVAGPPPLILESPDLQAIKIVNTPDLEKIILSSSLLQTPQPGLVFPTKARPVTSEQEAFGKGFEEALHSLHTSKNSQAQLTSGTVSNPTVTITTTTTTGNGVSGGSFTYTNLETFPVAIKDEPQNTSSSPPVSPIDMETQEKIKLERKRQRNRVAASKCRKRKLERISKLEDKVKILKNENGDLALVVKNLKDHVAQLKQQVMDHFESGCSIPSVYNGNAMLSK